jgi:hypothetical protein
MRHPGHPYQIGHAAVKVAVQDRPARDRQRRLTDEKVVNKAGNPRLEQEILSFRSKSVDILG